MKLPNKVFILFDKQFPIDIEDEKDIYLNQIVLKDAKNKYNEIYLGDQEDSNKYFQERGEKIPIAASDSNSKPASQTTSIQNVTNPPIYLSTTTQPMFGGN